MKLVKTVFDQAVNAIITSNKKDLSARDAAATCGQRVAWYLAVHYHLGHTIDECFAELRKELKAKNEKQSKINSGRPLVGHAVSIVKERYASIEKEHGKDWQKELTKREVNSLRSKLLAFPKEGWHTVKYYDRIKDLSGHQNAGGLVDSWKTIHDQIVSKTKNENGKDFEKAFVLKYGIDESKLGELDKEELSRWDKDFLSLTKVKVKTERDSFASKEQLILAFKTAEREPSSVRGIEFIEAIESLDIPELNYALKLIESTLKSRD